MKKNFKTSVCLILAAAFSFLLCFPITAMSSAEYNPVHLEKVRAFLETTDENGITNGQKINPSYDPQSPETWRSGMYGFFFNEAGDLTNVFILFIEVTGRLDVSGITTMHELIIYDGALDGIDITGCTGLQNLDLGRQNLTKIDGIETCSALTGANVNENKLVELHLSAPHLTTLYCYQNQLTELDLSQCPALTMVSCGYNPIAELDLSANPAIQSLYCHDMALSSLNVSSLTNLELLWCQNNNLSGSLDLTHSNSLLITDTTGNSLNSASLLSSWHGANVSINSIGGGYVSFYAKDTMVDEQWTFPVTCIAESDENVRFVHWIDDATGEIISEDPAFTIQRGVGGSFTAVFEPYETYLVFFVDRDGTLISRQSVEYGASATAPEAPAHEYYTFTEWAGGDYNNVTCDMVLVAQYSLNMIIGDVNYDGLVEITDALLAMRAAMSLINLDDEQLLAADANADMHLLITDAAHISRIALNLL